MANSSKTNKELTAENEVLKKRIRELEEAEAERNRTEKSLKNSHQTFLTILDGIDATIYAADMETYEILFMNKCMIDVFGGDLTGRFCYEEFRKENSPCRHCTNNQLLDTHGNPTGVCIWEMKNPKTGKWYINYDRAIPWVDGRMVRLQIATDITDRKRAEDALREQENKLSSIFRAAPVGIGMVINRVFREANDTLCQMTGYSREVLLGQDARMLYPTQEDYDYVGQEKYRQIDESRIGTVETRWKRKDGTVVDIILSSTPLDPDHLAKGVTFTALDITDRKRAEEEKQQLGERLQRAEKMEALGQLAGGVAHDLNNILGVLSGYSELLLLETPEGHRTRMHAEKILQSTEKGAAIIQDLLTLARRGVTASDVVNFNSIVSDFLKTPVFEKIKDYHPRVTFRTECDSNLLNIKGSPVHLEKTLMNLVSNAAESISGKGEVTIRTESRYLDKLLRGYDEVKEGEYAVLTVSDTGTGIPVENREKIFEPFYTKKTMGRSGTGLGLAIVWGTVKDHNGYIDLQTEVGEGTTFTLYFPVTQEELIAQQQKMPIERYMGKGESVLVVDDIAEQRDIAAKLLTRLGYSVCMVSSGEEAVEYLKGNKADILALDMIMAPGIDGLETYQRIVEINPKQKAILVSGFSETDRVKKAQSLGAGAYVKKPYAIEKIGVAIREELNRR